MPNPIQSDEYKARYRHNSRVNLPKFFAGRQKPCPDCRLRWHPSVMTFDHTNRSAKKEDLSTLIWYEPETFDAEISKGEFVCQNCHIVRELKRDRPLKDKFKEHYLNQLSIRGGILIRDVRDIRYEVRF